MTAELITWLNEQIDADEAAAAARPGSWLPEGITPDNPLAALYSPARTTAIRRGLISAWHSQEQAGSEDHEDHDGHRSDWTLRVLAATAYSDRPGYREEWAPADDGPA